MGQAPTAHQLHACQIVSVGASPRFLNYRTNRYRVPGCFSLTYRFAVNRWAMTCLPFVAAEFQLAGSQEVIATASDPELTVLRVFHIQRREWHFQHGQWNNGDKPNDVDTQIEPPQNQPNQPDQCTPAIRGHPMLAVDAVIDCTFVPRAH